MREGGGSRSLTHWLTDGQNSPHGHTWTDKKIVETDKFRTQKIQDTDRNATHGTDRRKD